MMINYWLTLAELESEFPIGCEVLYYNNYLDYTSKGIVIGYDIFLGHRSKNCIVIESSKCRHSVSKNYLKRI